MADNFDAIADPTRRRILQILNERGGMGEITAADLAAELGVTPPTATRHLAVLREHGFVSVREDGRVRYFRLDLAPFEHLGSWLADFVDAGHDVHAAASEDHSPVFAAWAGADVGATIGRTLAERSHRARSAIQGATGKVSKALPDAVGKHLRPRS